MQLRARLFLFVLWTRLAGRSIQSYKSLSFFSAFSCLDLFPQVFGEIAYPIVYFFVLWLRLAGRSAETYKQWSFFSIFSRFGPFPKRFWAYEGVAYTRIAWNEKSATCGCAVNGFQFPLLFRPAARNVQNITFLDFYWILGPFLNIWGRLRLDLC